MSVIEDLEKHFGVYRPPSRLHEWDTVKARLALGSSVQGKVVAQYPFGVFLDISEGFPVILLVVNFNDRERQHLFPVDYPAIGSLIEGKIYVLADDSHTIGIIQLPRES